MGPLVNRLALALACHVLHTGFMSITIPPVQLPPELAERLAGLDDEARQEANDHVVEALEDYLFEREHGHRIKALALAVRRGEVETLPVSELAVELGFDLEELRAEALA